MKVNIVQIGNSQGVRIPKILLEQMKFKKVVEFEILPEGLLLRPVDEAKSEAQPRVGWAEMFAAEADDAAEFADWNQTDLSGFDERKWL